MVSDKVSLEVTHKLSLTNALWGCEYSEVTLHQTKDTFVKVSDTGGDIHRPLVILNDSLELITTVEHVVRYILLTVDPSIQEV